MFTPHRTAVGALAGLLLASLGGCAVYPLPYAPPYASPAHTVNNVNPALAGQAIYAPAYSGYGVPDGRYAPAYPDPAGYSGAYASQPAHDSRGYGGQAYSDSTGQVVDVRRIGYRANPQASAAAGTAIGGIVGGAIGNSSGHRWNRGSNTLAGVIAGALIGSAIGTAASYQTTAVMYRVTARMDSGSVRTVDYANPPAIRIGDRVAFDGQQFYR